MKLRSAGVVLLAALLLASCGTRLPDDAFSQSSQRVATEDNGNTDDLGDDLGSLVDDTTNTTTAGGSNGGGGPTGNSGTNTNTGVKAVEGPNKASDIGITETTITIGNITAENGVLGDAFAPAVRGLRAWVAATNAKGGIRGRKIDLKTCDDREDRARNLACAQQLVERDKVFALVSTNTRVMGGSAQYLNDKGIPVIGFPITNSFARYPHFFSAYPNPYARDGVTVGYKGNLVNSSGASRWFKQSLGVSKAGVFAYDIDESKQAGEFIGQALKLEGFTVTQYLVSFAAPSFDQAVADMQRQGVQIVFDAMDDGANRKLCDAMARRNFQPKAKVSTIVSMGDRVGTDYNDTCRNSVFIINQSLPYTKTSVPEIARMRQAYARYQPGLDMHQWALESWALANMVAEGILSMGASPTRVGLEKWLNALVQYKGNGIYVGLDWGKSNPAATRVEDCFTIARWLDSKEGWTDATDKFPFCYPDAHQFLTKAAEQGN
jgi:branched-chain amino acid transport system substrate-binding protein